MQYHIFVEFGIPTATKWRKEAFKWVALWFWALSRWKYVPLLPPLVIIIIALLDCISRLLCNLALSALISRRFTSVELNVCLILWQLGSCHPSWKKTEKKLTVRKVKCRIKAPGLIFEHGYFYDVIFGYQFALPSCRSTLKLFF